MPAPLGRAFEVNRQNSVQCNAAWFHVKHARIRHGDVEYVFPERRWILPEVEPYSSEHCVKGSNAVSDSRHLEPRSQGGATSLQPRQAQTITISANSLPDRSDNAEEITGHTHSANRK